jgi:hypothetical protein
MDIGFLNRILVYITFFCIIWILWMGCHSNQRQIVMSSFWHKTKSPCLADSLLLLMWQTIRKCSATYKSTHLLCGWAKLKKFAKNCKWKVKLPIIWTFYTAIRCVAHNTKVGVGSVTVILCSATAIKQFRFCVCGGGRVGVDACILWLNLDHRPELVEKVAQTVAQPVVRQN